MHFYRPSTLKLARAPKFPRKSVPTRNKLDSFAVIKNPLTTESAMKKIEDTNTLVFIVDVKANKHQIRAAVKKLYNIDVQKVGFFIKIINKNCLSFVNFGLLIYWDGKLKTKKCFLYKFVNSCLALDYEAMFLDSVSKCPI